MMTPEHFQQKYSYAGSRNASMKRRMVGHDYQSPCIYMITMVVEGRRPLLGSLRYEKASLLCCNPICNVDYSDFGRLVRQNWEAICSYYPQVQVLACEIMPDHLHGILQVTSRLDVHLGRVLTGFRTGCNKVWRSLHPSDAPVSGERKEGLVFEIGYNDKILYGQEELNGWFKYLRSNPLRLAMKRAYPDLFRTISGIRVGGRVFSAIGNRFLLDYPRKKSVQLSRRLDNRGIEDAVKYHMRLADEGTVLVSAAISPAEKAVMRGAIDGGFPAIFLSSRPLTQFSKVGTEFHAACASGRFLIIAEGSKPQEAFSRELCLRLNRLAAEICGDG